MIGASGQTTTVLSVGTPAATSNKAQVFREASRTKMRSCRTAQEFSLQMLKIALDTSARWPMRIPQSSVICRSTEDAITSPGVKRKVFP